MLTTLNETNMYINYLHTSFWPYLFSHISMGRLWHAQQL